MIQSEPDEPAGYYARGFVHYSSDNYDQAVKDWSAAIDKVSEDNTELFKDLYFKRGSLYANMDEIEPAMKDFLRLIELDPAEGKYYQKLVVLYKEQSDYESAAKIYEKIIELEQDDDWKFIYFGLAAEAYEILGNFNNVASVLEKALEQNPDSSNAYWNLLGKPPSYSPGKISSKRGNFRYTMPSWAPGEKGHPGARLENIPLDIYIPKSYNDSESYGLIFFLHGRARSGAPNPSYAKVMDKHKLIWIGYDAYLGKAVPFHDQVNQAAIYHMMKNFNINRNRIYMSGLSWGDASAANSWDTIHTCTQE